MGINEIIMYIMMFFMLIAAVDRILSQFGGSARFLGKFGKSIEGSGGQFEEGFMAMGALGLAMVGMTALALRTTPCSMPEKSAAPPASTSVVACWKPTARGAWFTLINRGR